MFRKAAGLFAVLASAVTCSAIAAPQEMPAFINASSLPTHTRARLAEKAREGTTALVQYVNRTRMMGHQVRAEDLVRISSAEPVVMLRPLPSIVRFVER